MTNRKAYKLSNHLILMEPKNESLEKCVDSDPKLRDFVNQQILPYSEIEQLKSVIVYGSYARTPEKAKDIDILIIYDGDRRDFDHLESFRPEFDVVVFDRGWVENDIVGRRDLTGYRVLWGEDLFKNLKWEKHKGADH